VNERLLKAKKKAKKHIDRLKGGVADKYHPANFDSVALKEGIKVELEHTSNVKIAREIAMDHLVEDKNYYKKLKLIHKARGYGFNPAERAKEYKSKKAKADVIGTTSSGKSININPGHETHAKFTKEDHRDAYKAHAKAITTHNPYKSTSAALDQHKTALNHHFKMMNADMTKARKRKKKHHIAGKTSSGKTVHVSHHGANHPSYSDWSKQDHKDAMHLHHKRVMELAGRMGKKKKNSLTKRLLAHHSNSVHGHHKLGG